MKKNLRNILALSLGLMTTVAFAQDWGVDSRTRIDMSGDNDAMSTDQRVTLGATWGGSDWGIHLSSDVNYHVGGTDEVSAEVYEAYASTDLMGYANLTIGRQAINNGSGALMSSNDWGANRTTWDGMTFDLGLDMADISVGYASMNTGAGGDDDGNMWINASGEFSGWNVNMLYMTQSGNTAYDENGVGTPASENAATGIDISGEVMGAGISASMNTDYNENTMRVIGLSYAVNDDISVNVGQTVYGEDGDFNMAGTNMDGSWMETGGMGYLSAGDEDLSYGLSGSLAGISVGVAMHSITNSLDDEYERDVMTVDLGYSLGDNAGLGMSYATDGDDKYTWLTLTVTP